MAHILVDIVGATALALGIGMIFRGVSGVLKMSQAAPCVCLRSLTSLAHVSEAICNSADSTSPASSWVLIGGVVAWEARETGEVKLSLSLSSSSSPFSFFSPQPSFSLCLGLFWSSFTTSMTVAPPDMYTAVCVNGLAIEAWIHNKAEYNSIYMRNI